MQKLRERESEVVKRVAAKMKEVEKYNYDSRQRMIRDLENIKAKEQELDRLKATLEMKQLKLTTLK